MADELPPMPDEDAAAPADPLEGELVAYLDGELDPNAARKVEARLAADPEARAKAAALKKTFDLLDFLPKPEPSPTFATRTLDRVPAMTSGAAKVQAPSVPAVAGPPAATSASSSSPVVIPTGTVPLALAAQPVRWGLWAAGLLAAAAACVAAGYFGSDAVRSHWGPHSTHEHASPELPISDHRVVENLHLYAGADDLDFLLELAGPEFFGAEPAVSFDPGLKPPPVPQEGSAGAFEKHAAVFAALPAARQHAARELDRQLHAQEPPARRDRLFRVLEAYAVWLDRLRESDRRKVLAADTPRRRLDEIRELRNEQWFDSLPVALRGELQKLPSAEREGRILRWRVREGEEREGWDFLRRLAPDITANRVPWPFDTEAGQKSVVEFMRTAYPAGPDKGSRLSVAEQEVLRGRLATATERGGWGWYPYGRLVHEATRRYELLPEPAVGDPVTTFAQLGKAEKLFEKLGRSRNAVLPYVGKWPDFALAVHNVLVGEKGDKLQPPPLGPSRPSEFKEPLRTFVTKELAPALSPAEAKALEALQGKWPDYPREVVRLARQHDLVAPGLMPPGSPRRWEAVYTFGPKVKP